MTEHERSELQKLIRDVLEEHERLIEAKPPEAGPHSYVDESGHGWLSYTIAKGTFIQRLAALVTAIVLLAGLVNTGLQKMVVEPAIHEYVDHAIQTHSAAAEKQMEKIFPNLVTRLEYEKWTADKEQKWESQEALNKQMLEDLKEMRADIKELLKRTR